MAHCNGGLMPKKRGKSIGQRRILSKAERQRMKSSKPRRRRAIEAASKRAKWKRRLEQANRAREKKKRREAEQLRGLIKLTPEEERKVHEVLKKGETISREIWKIRNKERPDDMRSLVDVSRFSKVDIEGLVEKLHHRFRGQELVVLYEGCGFSTLLEELVRATAKKGIRLRVIKTDIYPKKRFERIARELNRQEIIRKRGVQITSQGYHQATPEMLAGLLGRKSVHLVISCLGGLMYTPIPKEKGLSNVSQILVHGGEAILTTHPTGKSGGRMISLEFGESEMKHRVKQFFAANPSLHAVEYVFPAMQQGILFNNTTLRIRRGIPFKKNEKLWTSD